MKTLIGLIHESNYAEDLREIEEVLTELETQLVGYRSLLTESENVNALFDETSSMLAAAKRGLGIANKLKDPEGRKKNRSRIMGTLNKLRAQLGKIAKAVAAA